VTEESSLQYNFLAKSDASKSFACVDGCIAVISVKSRLDSAQLTDSLLNISSIPDKQPLTQGRLPPGLEIQDFDDWPYKIICAFDGMELKSTLDTLGSFYEKNPSIPIHKRPNLIHVIGKYAIIRIPKRGGKTQKGMILEPNTFHGMYDSDGINGLIWTFTSIQSITSSSKIIRYEYGKTINTILQSNT
jgi:hypothetical protein